PTPGEAAQRFLEGRTVDRVVNDVDAVASGQLHDLVAKAARVIDRLVGTLSEANGSLLLGARGRDDLGAKQFGELDRRDADAAGGTMDQHPLARHQPSPL